MERDGLGAFEVLVLVLAGVAVLVVGVVWAGAALSLLFSGSPQGVAFSAAADALGRLPANAADPANAWSAPYSEALPAAPLYWLSTGTEGAIGADHETRSIHRDVGVARGIDVSKSSGPHNLAGPGA